MTLPVCPHCEHKFTSADIWEPDGMEFPTETDGDITETQCVICQQPLKIRLSLEPSWTFLDEDDEEISFFNKAVAALKAQCIKATKPSDSTPN